MADAWYLLFWAYEWNGPGDPNGYASIERALQLVARAQERNRDIIRAGHAMMFDDPENAERYSLDVISRQPDRAEAWYILGTAREFHRWRGRGDPDQALEALEKAYSLHSKNPFIAWNYNWALRNNRQWRLVDSIYAAATAAGRLIFFPEVQSLFNTVVSGTDEQRDSTIRAIERGETQPFAVNWAAEWIHSASDSMRVALAISSALANNNNLPTTYRAIGRLHEAAAEVALGHWTDARQSFLEAFRLESQLIVEPVMDTYSGSPLLLYALNAATPYLDVSHDELISIKDSLEDWDTPAQVSPMRGMSVELLPQIRIYLLGLLEARMGEPDAALHRATELEGLDTPADSIGLLTDLALEIRALVAAQEGTPEAALELIERQGMRLPTMHGNREMFRERPFGRLLRADLLADLGRGSEALAWYQGFPYLMNSGVINGEHLSHVYGRMCQIYHDLGEREKAIDYCTRFVTRWQDADPRFEPRVESAKARLAELQ